MLLERYFYFSTQNDNPSTRIITVNVRQHNNETHIYFNPKEGHRDKEKSTNGRQEKTERTIFRYSEEDK